MTHERSATKLDVKIGQRIRARRLEIGMSQEKLAELLGLTFQQVQKYEKGVNRVAASRLWDISAALKLSVAAFFPAGGRGVDGESGADAISATPEGARLLNLFSAIRSRKVRVRVVDLVEAMVNEGAKA